MSLLDLFSSGAHKRAKTYFAALIKLAFADGSMEEAELKFLQKMALDLSIENDEFVKILENPDHYPIDSPVDYNDRIEQLHHFTQMVLVASHLEVQELILLEKFAIGLGFSVKNAHQVTVEALTCVKNKVSYEEFSNRIKWVNEQNE